jgi:hypothetical protein
MTAVTSWQRVVIPVIHEHARNELTLIDMCVRSVSNDHALVKPIFPTVRRLPVQIAEGRSRFIRRAV